MNNLAIETLIKKREELFIARAKALNQFNAEIREVNEAIKTLSGKDVFEAQNMTLYDDESPDYIKSSSIED